MLLEIVINKGELGAWQTVAVKRLSKYSTVQEQGDAHREAAACEPWQAPGLLRPRGGEDPGVRRGEDPGLVLLMMLHLLKAKFQEEETIIRWASNNISSKAYNIFRCNIFS